MKQRTIKYNFLMNIILSMSTFIFPLITFPYVSRILLPEGTGKVSFATSLISYFLMLAQLGIPTYGIRTCAKVRDDRKKLTKTAQEILMINLIMGAVSYVLLFMALAFVPKLHQDRILYVIISSTILINAIGMEWLYKSLEQYRYIALRSVFFKFIALIAMFALVHNKEDYVIYGAISIFAASASGVLNFINVHRYIDCKYVGKYNLRKHLKPIMIFFAMSCATTIYTHLDTVMLGFMSSDESVGCYNAATKIKGILVSIVTALGAVILPRASYYIESKKYREFWRISDKALNFVVVMAVPMVVYFILWAKEGILFLSGAAYIASIQPMQLIMPTVLFIGLTNIMGIQILVPLGKEKVVLFSEISGAVVNVVVNLLLIPEFDCTGAAIGTLIAELVVLIVQYISLKKDIYVLIKNIDWRNIIIATVLGGLLSVWIKTVQGSYFLKLVVSSMLYFTTYTIFLLCKKEKMMTDILNQIKDMVRKKR